MDASAVYRARAPGVVQVEVRDGGGVAQTGSGWVADAKRGAIVTNAHVITNAGDASDPEDVKPFGTVYVELDGGERARAKVLGYDLFDDVAVLQVEPGALPLTEIPMGHSSTVQVGEPVAVIGSPFGRPGSLSVGVVSQVGRQIAAPAQLCFDTAGAIQTDAAMNRGNSGGPMLDARGRVIGVSSQINAGLDGGSVGVGYAIPVDAVRRSLRQILARGQSRYAWLGVDVHPVNRSLARRFSLPSSVGVVVRGVSPNSPASAAGLRPGKEVLFEGESVTPDGDLIVRADGRVVRDLDDLLEAIADRQPGETAQLGIWRDGKRMTVPVKLGERPLARDRVCGGGPE
jgi:S1-C subfamily serine protease